MLISRTFLCSENLVFESVSVPSPDNYGYPRLSTEELVLVHIGCFYSQVIVL